MNYEAIKKIANLFTNTHKRLCYFISNPQIDKKLLNYSLLDMLVSVSSIFVIISIFKELLPNFFIIDPIKLINWYMMSFLLITNSLIFAFLIYIFFSIVNKIKKIPDYNLLSYQAIYFYSIINILIVFVFVIGIDKIFDNKWNLINIIFLILEFILFIYFLFKLFINPIAKYLIKANYSKKTAYSLSILSIISVFYINGKIQSNFPNYFINVIDKKEFCIQFIDIKFHNNIVNLKQEKGCLIGKCMENFDLLKIINK